MRKVCPEIGVLLGNSAVRLAATFGLPGQAHFAQLALDMVASFAELAPRPRGIGMPNPDHAGGVVGY